MVKENGKNFRMLKIVIALKVIILLTKRMGRVYSNGKVEMYIKVLIKMMREMVRGKCIGLMALFIKENGREEYNMVKEKCNSQMDQLKKVFSKTIFIKDQWMFQVDSKWEEAQTFLLIVPLFLNQEKD
jgi:hypothetical protein